MRTASFAMTLWVSVRLATSGTFQRARAQARRGSAPALPVLFGEVALDVRVGERHGRATLHSGRGRRRLCGLLRGGEGQSRLEPADAAGDLDWGRVVELVDQVGAGREVVLQQAGLIAFDDCLPEVRSDLHAGLADDSVEVGQCLAGALLRGLELPKGFGPQLSGRPFETLLVVRAGCLADRLSRCPLDASRVVGVVVALKVLKLGCRRSVLLAAGQATG